VLPDGGRWTSVLPFGAPWALTLTFKHVRGPYPGISLDDPDVDLTSMDQIQVHTVRDETPMQSNLAGFDIVLLVRALPPALSPSSDVLSSTRAFSGAGSTSAAPSRTPETSASSSRARRTS
jgi:hypothetical protein